MNVKDIVQNMNLGVSRQTIAGEPNSQLHSLMEGLMQEVIDRLNTSIEKYDARASNRLKQSIISMDESENGDISIAISAEFYWKYVNFGVNGTQVSHGAPTWGPAPAGTLSFKDSILGWIRDKGLKAYPGQTYDDMAFRIMAGIKRDGIKPRPFFTDVVNKDLKKYLIESISEVLGKAITIEISEPWQ
jgi:hypothetical protein